MAPLAIYFIFCLGNNITHITMFMFHSFCNQMELYFPDRVKLNSQTSGMRVNNKMWAKPK